jgi:hypothetical protein
VETPILLGADLERGGDISFKRSRRTIRQHGQREPVPTFGGNKVLDGWNRVRACRLIGVEPWVMEFDPAKAKMTAEQLVVIANLRRRRSRAALVAISDTDTLACSRN